MLTWVTISFGKILRGNGKTPTSPAAVTAPFGTGQDAKLYAGSNSGIKRLELK
jgi:hypothetical protein